MPDFFCKPYIACHHSIIILFLHQKIDHGMGNTAVIRCNMCIFYFSTTEPTAQSSAEIMLIGKAHGICDDCNAMKIL